MNTAGRILPDQLQDKLKTLPEWRYEAQRGGLIVRDFKFTDFSQAFAFMTRVAMIAEKLNHHPEWNNVYNRVSISMTTHDAGGLSALDFEMASLIDAL